MENKGDTLYTIIYLDYVKALKNMGVDVNNISEKTITKWLNRHLNNVAKVHTPLQITLFNKKLEEIRKSQQNGDEK